MDKENCIFYKESGNCNHTAGDEHIIQNSLGGTLSSNEIICGACNNYFSQELDRHLVEFYTPIIDNLSCILPGKLKTKVRKVKSVDGLPIKLTAGGAASVEKIHKKFDEKGKLREISAPESISRQELESIAKKIGCPKSRWEFSRTLLSNHFERPEFVISLNLNSQLIRAVSLDLLEFTRYGTLNFNFPDIATHDRLKQFRHFIRNGTWPSGFWGYCYYAPISDLIEPLFKPSDFSHKLIVSYNNKPKSLILSAQFVDTMPWLIVLDNINLHSQSISFLHKKALIGGCDQAFTEPRAVISPEDIKWRTFSMVSRDAINFSRQKFCQSYRQQYGRAVYELDMRSDGEISETLSNRVEKYQKSELSPEVNAITEVMEIRYCKSHYLNDIKEQTYKMALSLWESKQTNNRKEREKTLDVYRACLKHIATNYGMPETIGEKN